MNGWLLAATLASAALHASWNAAVRASAQPVRAMTAQMLGSALLALPLLLWSGLPARSAWPWMAASTLLSTGAVASLLRGYAHAREWPRVLPVAGAAMPSYLLILSVWTSAPIALASALRDKSAVFATLIAVVVLKEPFDRSTAIAVGMATLGSMLTRLG